MKMRLKTVLAMLLVLTLLAFALTSCDLVGDGKDQNSQSDVGKITDESEKKTDSENDRYLEWSGDMGYVPANSDPADTEHTDTESVNGDVNNSNENGQPDSGVEKPDNSRSNFEFSYEIDRKKYERGETFEIVATVKNVSGKDHVYMGSYGEFRASVRLYCPSYGEEEYCIYPEDTGMTNEYREYVVPNGESRKVTYVFRIPMDAPLREYSLELSYNGESKIFNSAVVVDKLENVDIYNSTGIKVKYADNELSPASGFVYESFSNDVTGEGFEADGGGAWHYFREIDNWGTDGFLPEAVIRSGDKVEVEVPDDKSLIFIFYMAVGEEYNNDKKITAEGLSTLPKGEYYVVISIMINKVYPTGGTSESVYEDVFKLTVTE